MVCLTSLLGCLLVHRLALCQLSSPFSTFLLQSAHVVMSPCGEGAVATDEAQGGASLARARERWPPGKSPSEAQRKRLTLRRLVWAVGVQ